MIRFRITRVSQKPNNEAGKVTSETITFLNLFSLCTFDWIGSTHPQLHLIPRKVHHVSVWIILGFYCNEAVKPCDSQE